MMISLSSCAFIKQADEAIVPLNDDVTVSLICDEHSSSDSSLIQKVRKGENATFHMVFDEDYIFKSTSLGSYDKENHLLTINSLIGNSTVYFKSEPVGVYKLTVNNDFNRGEVMVTPNKEFYNYGDEVTLKVSPIDRHFLCYTYDLPFRNGVKQVSGVPLSYDEEIKIKVFNDTVVFTNYFEEDSKTIRYELNGGLTKGNNSYIETDYKPYYANEEYLFANTINLSSYAYKEGYVLESLNTKADGSGTRIGVGSRIDNALFINKSVTLYAQWKKYSAINKFTYQDIGANELAITGANINEEEIVIPAYINAQKVSKIKAHSFQNLTNVKKVIIPDTIKEIEDEAFVNMNSVDSILVYSSLEKVNKEAFDMPNLHTIFINKNTHVNEWNYEEDNLSRYKEAILNLDKSKDNVIFIGHSTTRVNHDLTPLDEKWGDKYNFFIYGATAGVHGYLLMMSIADIISINDYVIMPIWPLLNYSTSRNISFFQYNFDVLKNANYQIVKDFFWDSFTSYRVTCTNEIGVTALLPEATNYARWDKYGMNLENIPTDDVNNKAPYDYTHYLDEYDGEDFSYISLFADAAQIEKDHILLTWNTYNINNIDDTSYYVSFEDRIRNYFNDYTFFDSQLENIYPGHYFNKNDFMHLSADGAVYRVNRWLNELPLD